MKNAAQSLLLQVQEQRCTRAGETTRTAPVHTSLCWGGLSPLSNLDSFKGQLFRHMDSDGQGLSQREPSYRLKYQGREEDLAGTARKASVARPSANSTITPNNNRGTGCFQSPSLCLGTAPQEALNKNNNILTGTPGHAIKKRFCLT